MRLLAGLASAVAVYLSLGLALGVRPTAGRRRAWVSQWPQLETGAPLAARHRFRVDRFVDWLAQAEVIVRPRQFMAVAFSVGTAGAALAFVATGATVLGALAGLAGLVAPVAVVGQRRRRLLADRQAAWPDALRDISTQLRAGRSLHAAMRQLAETGPRPLQGPFSRYQLLAAAIDQRAGLETVRAELADPVSDRIIEILMVGLDQGPSVVVDVLDELARSTTEDVRLVEEIRTAQMETKLEARGAAALPFVVLALLCATSTDYRAFYQTPLGWVVVCGGGLLACVGLVVISRLGTIPSEERVLTGEPS